MKKLMIIFSILVFQISMAQTKFNATVVESSSGVPIEGAVIKIENTNKTITSDSNGNFTLDTTNNRVKLLISYPGFETQSITLIANGEETQIIKLREKFMDIEAITLSTGYQKIPKERSTGSFTTISNRQLNQQVSTNILDRLPAIASGLMVDKGTLSSKSQIMVRGLSTIRGPKSPLIVVDNFPYEGDLSNINPNIIENVTILKDAAASSIWGARAANGVIVITTKSASFNKPLSVNFSSFTSISPKPDLHNIKQMSSSDFIDMEIELFNQGFYNSDLNSTRRPVVSPVVDLLDKEKKGFITSEEANKKINFLKSIDSRDQFLKYMYQPSFNQQYSIDVSAGSQRNAWISSLGYDNNEGNLGEIYRRLNLRISNSVQLLPKVTLSTAVNYTDSESQTGRTAYGSIAMKAAHAVPYLRLVDDFENPSVVFINFNQNYKESFGNKLQNWNYYPLNDYKYSKTTTHDKELIIAAGLNYKLMQGLEADAKYQRHMINGSSENLNSEESYFARNYVNQFAQIKSDGSVVSIIPKGGIIGKSFSNAHIDNLRTQLNLNRVFDKNALNAIVGAEIKSANVKYDFNRYYGYNQKNKTFGVVDYSQQFPLIYGGTSYIENLNNMGETNQRFVSMFANASYTYDNRYTLSGSIRRDASNLFGLKTNDQWNPFWSAGLAWNLANEKFYQIKWLPNLKLRSSYGFNGNIDPAMVAVTTIAYSTNNSVYTGMKTAGFSNFYNPNLRWETIRMFNIGLDFATMNNRLSGSFEYYQKKGDNLFGQAPLDYTNGILSLLWNVAGMKGEGIDINLKSVNIDKSFKWQTMLNFTVAKDKVTKYFLNNTFGRQFVLSTVPISGVEGLPVYSVFAYKWAGLDPATGDPQGYLDGKVSKDYAKITGTGTDLKDLQYFGSAVPTNFGSFINSFSYRNLNLDVGLIFKLGYWFRRSSVNYTNLYRDWYGHSDYSLRWQKTGDELVTIVPSSLLKTNANRDNFYTGSSVLVEKGDHVRFQYITLNYNIAQDFLNYVKINNLQLFLNVQNLGLLWKANQQGIDPDYNLGSYRTPQPTTYSLGLKIKF